MSTLMITTATERDLDDICALEAVGFEHGQWSKQAWREELDGLNRHVVVLRVEDEGVLGVAAFQLNDDTADLNRVIVAPQARRMRIGTRLVRDGLAWAKREGAERCLLEVEATNEPARTMYELLEFREIARRADYYGAGRDALVMERSLA